MLYPPERAVPGRSGAGQVLAGTGINLDALALVDEQRHLNDSAGLQRRGLQGVGRGIAGKAGFGGDDLQLDECGGPTRQNASLVGS